MCKSEKLKFLGKAAPNKSQRSVYYFLEILEYGISIYQKSVLERAQQTRYSDLLLRQQLILFGKVARAEDTDILRRMTFRPGSFTPVTDSYVRNVGRPHHEWAKMLLKEASRLMGPSESLTYLVRDTIRWKARVFEYTSR